jgi:hypothetical protein
VGERNLMSQSTIKIKKKTESELASDFLAEITKELYHGADMSEFIENAFSLVSVLLAEQAIKIENLEANK